jgi:hypothetical protein
MCRQDDLSTGNARRQNKNATSRGGVFVLPDFFRFILFRAS